MDVSQEELNHEDELVQNRLESVDEGSLEEEPVLPISMVLDVCPRLELPVDEGLVPLESVLGFVPDSLRLVVPLRLPMESLDAPESLREVLSSLVVVDCSDEVGASLVVVSVVEFSVRLLSSEEESNSSEDGTLEGAVEASLCEDDSSLVVVSAVREESDVSPPESESVRFHEGFADEPSEPSEPSELLSELPSLESSEEMFEPDGSPYELPPPPPPPGEERTKSVSEMSPPFEGMWSGSSQRSSWGGSGHCSRGSSGPTSKRNRGA